MCCHVQYSFELFIYLQKASSLQSVQFKIHNAIVWFIWSQKSKKELGTAKKPEILNMTTLKEKKAKKSNLFALANYYTFFLNGSAISSIIRLLQRSLWWRWRSSLAF